MTGTEKTQNSEQEITLTHRFSVAVNNLSHFFVVRAPTSFAKLIDSGSRWVNEIPQFWDSEPFVDQPLQYADYVHEKTQSAFNKMNAIEGSITGFTPPAILDDTDAMINAAADIAGHAILAGGALKAASGLSTASPYLGKIFGGVARASGAVGKFAWRHKLLTAAAATDAAFGLPVSKATAKAAGSLASDALAEYGTSEDLLSTDQEVKIPKEDTMIGGRTQTKTAQNDFYHSVFDPIENMTGFNVPDGLEATVQGITGWFSGGSTGSLIALGLTTLLGSNMILDKMIGNSMISGILSLGLTAAVVMMGPDKIKDWTKGMTEEQEAPEQQAANQPTQPNRQMAPA